jgi:hypothetical protein
MPYLKQKASPMNFTKYYYAIEHIVDFIAKEI